MDFVRRILATDPIVFRNVITAVAALAVSFGVQIGDEQTNAAVDLVLNIVAFGGVILAFLDRSQVFSRATHEAEVAAAREAGVREGYNTYGGIDYQ